MVVPQVSISDAFFRNHSYLSANIHFLSYSAVSTAETTRTPAAIITMAPAVGVADGVAVGAAADVGGDGAAIGSIQTHIMILEKCTVFNFAFMLFLFACVV